ncbi:uncharacterized protein TRAVEDRAFT_43050 [Trametes versicolor FP-101664 SS1]|uniref:uncharacterized protein n=1 Tax=Trametes versicolor (strain FP-101664) TaxID=717944 RepID=UPI000462477D|nr:uncharacterized protein TRAVEDRAFT_43050 [Trametes versicolor FP-101664 SS1]EIW62712.1 hypothetical protein TRAVEDRAFT_43050 [Trametes versicolor FP-101664 SS1]
MARTASRAKATTEQRRDSRKNTAAMWEAVNAERAKVQVAIFQLAKDYKRSPQWVASQLYCGGKLLAPKRRKSLFNAALHNLAQKRKEEGNTGDGRKTLTHLSEELSLTDWKDLSDEEKEKLLAKLQEDSAATSAPARRVTGKHNAHDIEGTMTRIDPEMDGLAQRTGCQYLSLLTRGDVQDNWAIRTVATPKVKEACIYLFKCTPDDMAMKIEAYAMLGIAGVLKLTNGKRSTLLKAEIRAKINEGLREVLLARGITNDNIPNMVWARYERDIVCKYGVELIGWTEPPPIRTNPSDFKQIEQLERAHAALHGEHRPCRWIALSDAEWEKRKEATRVQLLNNKKASGTRKKGPISPETIEDSSEDSGGEGA